MKCSVVLTGREVDLSLIDRGLRSLESYGECFELGEVFVAAIDLDDYRDSLTECPHVFDTRRMRGLACVVYIDGERSATLRAGAGLSSDCLGFAFSWQGRLRPLNDASRDWLGSTDVHAFSKASRSADQFYFFPYGYLYRDNSVGPINSMGFRVPEDLGELVSRDRDRLRLVCVFGGSAAFSMYCLSGEMFAAQLEAKLNNRDTEDRPRYRVLNFGMHGHVMLNQILTYLLWVQRLRPDVVIAHDGFNDLAYGCNSDKRLLEDHQVVYQENMELWALSLADRKEDMENVTEDFYKVSNFPRRIVKSYLERKSQFRRLVESDGARFIAGFQPYLSQKPSLTDWEQGVCGDWTRQHRMRPYFDRMDFLFDQYLAMKGDFGFADSLDFRESLVEQTGCSVFADFMHLRPEGDGMVANLYFRHFERLGL